MNIKDVKNPEIQGDMLDSMVERQYELEAKYSEIEAENGVTLPTELTLTNLDTFEGQQYIRDLIGRAASELFEAYNCMRWKPWSKGGMPTDQDHFLEEIADAVHFVLAIFVILGLTAPDVYGLYMRKSKVNQFRQRSDY